MKIFFAANKIKIKILNNFPYKFKYFLNFLLKFFFASFENLTPMEEVKQIDIQVFDNYIIINGFRIYVDQSLREILLDEYQKTPQTSAIAQFNSLGNIPGLIQAVGLPDIHGGYSFPIGSIAAVDLAFANAGISPEGVGYDINCGVRCLKTNLKIQDFINNKQEIAEKLFSNIPSGIGGSIIILFSLFHALITHLKSLLILSKSYIFRLKS